jgi:cell fate regulator YaaT (PSP1 superfamily)
MVKVIGVKFRNSGRVYYFDPGDLDIRVGQGVVVETARGVEYADVTMGVTEVAEDKVFSPLKPVDRIATEEDLRMRQYYWDKEKEAFPICEQKIQDHGLDMKLVNVEYNLNGSKVVFYFTADDRVDFRELVKDLAYVFKTRIELRQIGVRDEAKMLGGLGPCGRPVCCKQFLDDFRPVTIKMAKEQNLALSPTKISGLCGRLMCCLQYEESCYEEMHKLMPKTGKEIETPDGVGVVVENNVITEKTKVKLTAEDGTIDIKEYPYEDLGPGARERAEQRAAQAAATATDGPASKGFTPLQTGSQLRSDRDRNRQSRRPGGEPDPQQKGKETPAKADKPQPKGDKAQLKPDKTQPSKGDRNNPNRGGKSNRDKQPKPDVPVPKSETGDAPAPVAVPESGTATVPFSRKRRPNYRRRSFGPKTPGGTGGQKG